MKSILILLAAFFTYQANAKEFTIGVENINYYPHYDFSVGKKSGYIYDLLELFSSKNNHHFKYVVLPVKRLRKKMLETNQIDFMYPDNPIWEQYLTSNDNKIYSDPIITTIGGTLVKKERLGKGVYAVKSLSIPHGFTSTEWLKIKKERSLEILEVQDAKTALGLVIKGRVDAADVEYNVSQHLLKKMNKEKDVKLDPQLPFIDVSFKLSTLNHISTINEFNIFLSENKKSIDVLKKKYKLIESVDEIY